MKRYERRAASPCRANSAQNRAQRRIKPRDYPHDRGGTKAPQIRRKRPGRAALVEPRTTAKKRTRNAQRREAEFQKKYLYIMRSKRNLKPPRRFEGIRPRTGTGGELGSAAGNPTANRRRKSGRFFRRPRPRDSARTPGRLVEGREMVAAYKCAFECSVSGV